MNRIVKIIGLLVVALVALFVIAAVFFLLFFDPNDFREEISAAVRKETGRELQIEGDVSLSLFPWLAIDVGRARLGNAPGFGDKPFAEFERARLSVRLLPMLLRREVAINTAALESLQLNLQVDPRGKTNWDDLLGEDASAPADAEATGGSAIEVSGVDISNTTITYEDRQSGDTYVLSEMNMRLGRMADDGTPVPASGAFRFDMQPADMRGEVDLDTVLSFDLKKGLVLFDGLTIEGVLEGVATSPTRLKFRTERIELQTRTEVATIEPLELNVLGLDIKAALEPFSYSGEVLPVGTLSIDTFSPKSLMTVLDIEVPETADPSALSRLTLKANVAMKSNAMQLSKVTITLDDTKFSGTLSVPRSSTGAYSFDLSADSIDLDRYMEPGSTAAEGTAGESAAVEIPVDMIRPLNAQGNLRVAKATLSGMQFDDVVLGLNSAKGRLRLNPVTARLFGGSYSGDVRIDASAAVPVLSVNEKIQDVDMAKLAQAMFEQDNITGTINGGFVLSGRGNDMDAVQQSLSGNLSFQLNDGTYEGTDIWYELRRARALLKGGTAPKPELPARTRFSSVSATGVVNDGVMQNDDLSAELPFMQISGRGRVDLAAATVNYDLTARVLERPESLQGVTEEELKDFTKAVIPLKITGPLTSPSVKPDVGKLLRQKVEAEVKDRLLDKLLGGKKKAPAEGEAGAAPPAEGEAGTAEPAEGEPEEPAEEESAEDQLKKKLKGLFD